MKPVRLVDEARTEFLKEISYYEALRAGLGGRFRAAVTDALTRAGAAPLSGKPAGAGTRRLLVKGFPFALVYLVAEDAVMVYAVSHLSRAPDYWIHRLKTPDR